MLSHTTSEMDQSTPRQHLRQQSTPTHFDVSPMPSFPAHQQPGSQHRRGMSLIEPMHHQYQQEYQQPPAANHTNTGQPPQHYLSQEAQQHSQARPGYPEQQSHLTPEHEMKQELEHFRQLQHRQLDAQIDLMMRRDTAHSFGPAAEQHAHKMERARSGPGTFGSMPLRDISEGSAVLMPNGLLAPFSPTPHQRTPERPSSARIERGFEDRVSLRSDWQPYTQRATTPVNRNINGNFPSPSQTSPFAIVGPARLPRRQPSPADSHPDGMDTSATIRAPRFTQRPPPMSTMQLFSGEAYHEDMDLNATIKVEQHPKLIRGLSHSDIFNWDGPCEQASQAPHTAPIRRSRHFDVAVQPSEVRPLHFAPAPGQVLVQFPSTPSVEESNSPHAASMAGSPESRYHSHRGDVASMVNIGNGYGHPTPDRSARQSVDFCHPDSSEDGDPASREMSLADLNLDATIEETGISAEEVQQYISQPHPITGKWTCLFEGCNKEFGRKENVRAHVQTHLGDRQYRCIHCGKCFVRQHDLKRHSKTHSGVKPYPCRCGNSFARHDALTRHRQRGICSGGFEGAVKKQAKRGRPRKQRPEDDERANKSAVTRKRTATKNKDTYAESASGTSESSHSASPQSVVFDLADLELPTSGAVLGFDGTFEFPHLTLRPEMLIRTPPYSPVTVAESLSPHKSLSLASGHSPRSALLEFNSLSPAPSNTASPMFQPAKSSHFSSAASSPPELSHSSPPASARQLDFSDSSRFDSSGSKHAMEEQQLQSSPEFESLSYSDSPDQYFDDADWKTDSLFNFESSDSAAFKFTGSFDDDILFSDSVEVPRQDFF